MSIFSGNCENLTLEITKNIFQTSTARRTRRTMQVVFPGILLESEAGILKNYCATNAGSFEVWSMGHTHCSNSELGGMT